MNTPQPWMPALRVAGVLGPRDVRVDAAHYSDDDLAQWARGDVTSDGLTVEDAGGGVVVFSGPHGLRVGDIIRKAAPT